MGYTRILGLSALLFTVAGCGDATADDGADSASGGDQGEGAGGTVVASGGSNSGGQSSSSGGQAAGSGGATGGPPILPEVPEIAPLCEGASENCVRFSGHWGETAVDVDCELEDAMLLGSTKGTFWGCLGAVNWNVSYPIADGPFAFDIDPSDEDQVTNFWLSDTQQLNQMSPGFAGTHCEGSRENSVVQGTCYSAWGANADGTYESEVSASFSF